MNIPHVRDVFIQNGRLFSLFPSLASRVSRRLKVKSTCSRPQKRLSRTCKDYRFQRLYNLEKIYRNSESSYPSFSGKASYVFILHILRRWTFCPAIRRRGILAKKFQSKMGNRVFQRTRNSDVRRLLKMGRLERQTENERKGLFVQIQRITISMFRNGTEFAIMRKVLE